MARQSLRRYLTFEQLQGYQPSVVVEDNNILIEAEKDIDNIIANFYQGVFRKSFYTTLFFESVTLTPTTATISSSNFTNGELAYTVLEILSGANTGSRFAIRSNTSNVLTYFDTNALSTGTEAVKIYQFGKCPMIKDKNYIGSNYNKTISEQIKEAVAYQYVFRTENDINVKNPVTSYSVSQDSYSEHFAVDKPLSITERISPQAMDILGGLTIQTI
jgi:hypothetical protein